MSKEIINQRVTANLQEEVVVFMIGMRINKWWKLNKSLPVALAMPRMIRELYQNPVDGLLHIEARGGNPSVMIQYWKSFEHLEKYARNTDKEHFPAWQAFNKAMAGNDDVGIWHETYLIKPGQHESVYNNMPLFGLGKAVGVVPATGRRQRAAERLTAHEKSPVAVPAAGD